MTHILGYLPQRGNREPRKNYVFFQGLLKQKEEVRTDIWDKGLLYLVLNILSYTGLKLGMKCENI